VDTPQTLAAAMLKAAAEAVAGAATVVAVGANNIKRDARANVQKSAPVQNAHAQYAITYSNPTVSAYAIESEIGYDKDLNGGALGNLLEFGGGGDKSPPHRDLGRALDAEEPRFESALSKLPGIAL